MLQEKLLNKNFGKLHWIFNRLTDLHKASVKLVIRYFKIDTQFRDVLHLSKSLLETTMRPVKTTIRQKRRLRKTTKVAPVEYFHEDFRRDKHVHK